MAGDRAAGLRALLKARSKGEVVFFSLADFFFIGGFFSSLVDFFPPNSDQTVFFLLEITKCE